MPHTYAFLWVLLLLRGNDIRFYRGKQLTTDIKKILKIMRKDVKMKFILVGRKKSKDIGKTKVIGLPLKMTLKQNGI